jgi:hypothetical protein
MIIDKCMKETIEKLKNLRLQAEEYFQTIPLAEFEQKSNQEKWSKKEILGHLIDSGINNLQRFTEIQFNPKPFPIRPYRQSQLVIANDYQNAETKELLRFWLAINHRIEKVMAKQTPESLNYEILIDDSQIETLEFLMKDYVIHLEHHLLQIFGKRKRI